MRHGFYYIELHPDFRDFITVLTHEGLFRCRRFSFGVSAPPEKYQHIIRQVVAGVGTAVNMADDLVVHVKMVAEHNRNLQKLLARLEDKNLTLNGGKCTFRLNEVLVFIAILLSEHGT